MDVGIIYHHDTESTKARSTSYRNEDSESTQARSGDVLCKEKVNMNNSHSFQHQPSKKMYYCYLCMQYERADSLKRHFEQKHSDALGNENRKGECKVMKQGGPQYPWFTTRKDQQQGEADKQTCKETVIEDVKQEKTEKESEVKTENESDELIWVDVLTNMYHQTKDKYCESVNSYMMKGMNAKEAEQAAKHEMLDIHEKLLRNTFVRVLVIAHILKQTNILDEDKREVCRLGKRKARAVFKNAVEKNTLFPETLDSQQNDEDEPAWKKKRTLFG